MKIVNKTKWRTCDLRAFVLRILPVEIDDPEKRKKIVVTFINSRTRGNSGYVYEIGGTRAWIRLPSPNREQEALDRRCGLAMVIAHELAHLRGYGSGHANERALQSSAKYGWKDGKYKQYYAWAMEMPLRPAEPKSKASGESKYESEVANLNVLIAKWQAKQKRAETAIKKYRQRLKYREGKLAAIRAESGKAKE